MAVMENLVVVSRDTSEFIAVGVPVLDPWSLAMHARCKSYPLETPVNLDALGSVLRKLQPDRI